MMYPVAHIVPQGPAWPVFWALFMMMHDQLLALTFLPRDILSYIRGVLSALIILPSRLAADATEYPQPPSLTSFIPILGHLWYVFTEGSNYVRRLDQKYKLPLFTMTIPGYRVYVATSPEAVRAIHKNPKTMEFTEIQRIAMRKLFYYPEEAIDTLGVHLNGDGTLKLINKPGPELDEVNQKGQDELVKSMQTFSNKCAHGSIDLCKTLRQTLTVAICCALWGPEYPMLFDETLEEDFWTWVQHFWSLLILPAPSLTASKGHAARERLCEALLQYTRAGGHRLASKVVSAEYHLYKSLGLGDDIVARAGTVSLFVVLSNTVMAGNWLTMIIFSKPDLLAQIREEVTKCTSVDAGNPNKRIINSTKLKTECPILLATFRETLRHYMDFSLNRFVGDDTHVRLPGTDQIYALKKNSIVQVASPLMQMQESIWGTDTNQFRPCRFMQKEQSSGCPVSEARTITYGIDNKTSVPDPARPAHVTKDQKTAFAAFGGGAHVCPGRHFAFHIIAAFVAELVSAFDIIGEVGQSLIIPETEKSLGHGIKLPHGDVKANVIKRVGYEDVEFAFEL